MKMKQSTNIVLLLLFIVSLIIYIVIFASAFMDLPMNIPPWHQLLLLAFHFFPMLFLELLLCQNAKLKWRLLIPILSLLAVGVWFLSFAGWELLGWLPPIYLRPAICRCSRRLHLPRQRVRKTKIYSWWHTPFLYLYRGGSVAHYTIVAEMPQEAISPCLLSEP